MTLILTPPGQLKGGRFGTGEILFLFVDKRKKKILKYIRYFHVNLNPDKQIYIYIFDIKLN